MRDRENWAGRSVLLLQGPIGPYFKRLSRDLRAAGARRVLKINFCGGDEFFYPRGIRYSGETGGASAFVKATVLAEGIDSVMLLGDCRPVHAGVAEVCAEMGAKLYVFEEGYFRPAYVTCEVGGVNGYSSIPTSPDFYRALGEPPSPCQEIPPSRWSYYAMSAWAILYYLASLLLRERYPRYRHHRSMSVLGEGVRWARGIVRKYRFAWRERGLLDHLANQYRDAFFLVPLQVHNDAQVLRHSDYTDVDQFIEQVLISFARYADPCHQLVIKHHPMDRAYRHYGPLIEDLARAHGVHGRVHYVHDLHLPTLLDAACGAVVVNSTVGLAAVHQGVPTKVMGRAFYNFAGLTFQGSLDAFWHGHADQRPDPALYRAFRHWVITATQINDNFYVRISRPAVPHSARTPAAGMTLARSDFEALPNRTRIQ